MYQQIPIYAYISWLSTECPSVILQLVFSIPPSEIHEGENNLEAEIISKTNYSMELSPDYDHSFIEDLHSMTNNVLIKNCLGLINTY